MTGDLRVAVIGGGVAGLAAAFELEQDNGAAAPRIDLFEAADRVGGVIQTETTDGLVLDAGPDSLFRLKPWALDLCEEVGLGPDLIATRSETSGLALYSRGRLRRLPLLGDRSLPARILGFLKSGLLSPWGLLRMGGDLFLPSDAPERDQSMSEFFGRRLGREAVERLIDPFLAGIYAGDPDRLSIHATYPRFPKMVQEHRSLALAFLKGRRARRGGSGGSLFYSLPGGLGRFVERIAERLEGTRIHLVTPVAAVSRSNGAYRVRTEGGATHEFDSLILAVTAPVAARLVREWDDELARRLERIRYASSATVFHAFRKAEMDARPEGHGFLVPSVEGRRINGATWVSRKYEGRAPDDLFLARCYVGGDRTGEQLARNDAELSDVCREELRAIAGIRAEPVLERVYRFEEAGPQYEVGHAERVRAIEEREATHPGLFLTGAGYRGVGIPDCVRDGREVARRLLAAAPRLVG